MPEKQAEMNWPPTDHAASSGFTSSTQLPRHLILPTRPQLRRIRIHTPDSRIPQLPRRRHRLRGSRFFRVSLMPARRHFACASAFTSSTTHPVEDGTNCTRRGVSGFGRVTGRIQRISRVLASEYRLYLPSKCSSARSMANGCFVVLLVPMAALRLLWKELLAKAGIHLLWIEFLLLDTLM
jgi:hypothetical protein